MRSFHEIEGFKPPEQKLSLPKNILLLATHGTQEIPAWMHLSDEMDDEKFGLARQRDFSDYGTGLIQEYFEPARIVTPPRYGRIAGDPNRELSTSRSGDADVDRGKETFRTTNSSGRFPLWKSGSEPTHYEKLLLLDEHHGAYYEKITASILSTLQQTEGDVLVVDLHDTGDGSLYGDGTVILNQTRMNNYGRSTFWEAVLSDLEGKTAKPHVFRALLDSVQEQYSSDNLLTSADDISVNAPYKGGNVTKYVGLDIPEKLKGWGQTKDAERINAIQLEIPRHRYIIDECTQEIDPRAIGTEALRLQKVLINTSIRMN